MYYFCHAIRGKMPLIILLFLLKLFIYLFIILLMKAMNPFPKTFASEKSRWSRSRLRNNHEVMIIVIHNNNASTKLGLSTLRQLVSHSGVEKKIAYFRHVLSKMVAKQKWIVVFFIWSTCKTWFTLDSIITFIMWRFLVIVEFICITIFFCKQLFTIKILMKKTVNKLATWTMNHLRYNRSYKMLHRLWTWDSEKAIGWEHLMS